MRTESLNYQMKCGLSDFATFSVSESIDGCRDRCTGVQTPTTSLTEATPEPCSPEHACDVLKLQSDCHHRGDDALCVTLKTCNQDIHTLA